jgi:hypothetical protein
MQLTEASLVMSSMLILSCVSIRWGGRMRTYILNEINKKTTEEQMTPFVITNNRNATCRGQSCNVVDGHPLMRI